MKKDITKSTVICACAMTFILTVVFVLGVVMVVQFFDIRRQAISGHNQGASSGLPSEATDTLSDSNDHGAHGILPSDMQFAAFSNSGFEITDISLIVADLEEYVSAYDAYNSHTFYISLNEDEKLIYHIFEYALDNSYSDIFIDISLLGNCNYSAKQILDMYSLDSAMVEQNIRFTDTNPLSITIEGTISGLSEKIVVEGYYFHTPTFEASKLQKKEEAIQKANEIVLTISEQGSEYEKAEAIFGYLVDHITYDDDKVWYEADYLYDALCVGATNCDGYSNAFSLLANLCGLNGFEKKYYPSDGGDGHTWNCVCIDGVWYNVDAQAAASSLMKNFHCQKVSELKDYQKVIFYCENFCVSDAEKGVMALYNELAPACSNDMIEADIEIFCEREDVDAIPTIASVFPDVEKPYTVLITDFKMEDEDFQRLYNTIGTNFSRSSILLNDGRYVYALKSKG